MGSAALRSRKDGANVQRIWYDSLEMGQRLDEPQTLGTPEGALWANRALDGTLARARESWRNYRTPVIVSTPERSGAKTETNRQSATMENRVLTQRPLLHLPKSQLR